MMTQPPPALDYAPAPARVTPSPLLYCLVIADCIVLLLTLSLLHYPEGASGSFFAPEAYLAIPLALTASVAGLAYCLGLVLKHRYWLALIVLFLSIIPVPMFCVGYHIVDGFKHFNFGPG